MVGFEMVVRICSKLANFEWTPSAVPKIADIKLNVQVGQSADPVRHSQLLGLQSSPA